MKQVNITPISKMLSEEIEPSALADIIDRIEHKYALLVIRNSQNGAGEEEAGELYYLRLLRNALYEAQTPELSEK